MMLLLVSAVAETLSIGAILPFLAAMVDPASLARVPVLGEYLGSLPAGPGLVAWMAGIFVGFALLSGILRLTMLRFTQALAFNISNDLAVSGFHKLLRQDFDFYVKRHSGDLLAFFDKVYQLTFNVIVAGVQAFAASMIAVMIVALLVAVSPGVTFAVAGGLVSVYAAVLIFARRQLQRNSHAVDTHWNRRIKIIQESIGSIRDVLLDHSHGLFEREFAHSSDQMRRAFISNAWLSAAPRMLIETLGITAIGLYIWVISGEPGGIVAAMPVLGALALGAQRLLPQIQLAYMGWTSLAGNYNTLRTVAELLQVEPLTQDYVPGEDIELTDALRFEDVGFSYAAERPVLMHVDLAIAKGERIGVVGPTGSGKSTLMDLLLGLLEPTSGRITIDGRPFDRKTRTAWQRLVAHVPQTIYLSDTTIAANIAFGNASQSPDMDRVRMAARRAGIADFIEQLPDGYATRTGERGVQLSGGQRQRIGIARALYRDAQVLVLDEATSALDTETEAAIMRSIGALGEDITIVMISHRPSTLAICDRVVHVEDGRIARIDQASIGVAP